MPSRKARFGSVSFCNYTHQTVIKIAVQAAVVSFTLSRPHHATLPPDANCPATTTGGDDRIHSQPVEHRRGWLRVPEFWSVKNFGR